MFLRNVGLSPIYTSYEYSTWKAPDSSCLQRHDVHTKFLQNLSSGFRVEMDTEIWRAPVCVHFVKTVKNTHNKVEKLISYLCKGVIFRYREDRVSPQQYEPACRFQKLIVIRTFVIQYWSKLSAANGHIGTRECLSIHDLRGTLFSAFTKINNLLGN
jgi:hypothetical protein